MDEPIMRLAGRHIIPFITCVTLALGGCYTVLVHPEVREASQALPTHVSIADNCIRCHSEQEVQYFYGELEMNRTMRSAEAWTADAIEPFSYFNYPWWFQDSWITRRGTIDRKEAMDLIEKTRTRIRRETDARGLPPAGGSSRGYIDDRSSSQGGAQTSTGDEGSTRSTTRSSEQSSSGSSSGAKTGENTNSTKPAGGEQRTREVNPATPQSRSGSTRGK